MKLIELLRKNSIYVDVPCNGNGTCGKCKVKCNELPITDLDREFLSEEEMLEGIRLACFAEVEESFDINKIDINYTKTEGIQALSCKRSINSIASADGNIAIAIDIGTTTIAIAVVDLSTNKVIDDITAINPQRSYGADVITRIKASNEGCIQRLQDIIVDCINVELNILIQRNNIDSKRIIRIAVAANTTMIHLLLGYSCNEMGQYPFKPYSTEGVILEANNVLKREDLDNSRLIIIPMVSAFIGGDIVAGIYTSGMYTNENISLLLDLGTNGELVLGNCNRLISTSTAAGPAFEGGNISIGVPSIPGAVNDTYIIGKNRIQYRTIDGKTPIGLCGSGLISLVSDMIDCYYIDTDGVLCAKYFDDGYPILNSMTLKEKDIRELQLAKSAIRSGIEILCENYGIIPQDISCIYIAGGFGTGLNTAKALNIGLIPETNANIYSIGNSSLKGAIECCINDKAYDLMTDIAGRCETVYISDMKDFSDKYLQYMSFGEKE